MRFLRPIGTLCYLLFTPRAAREFDEACKTRPLLDDTSFYALHYGSSGIPCEVPVFLRQLLTRHLGKSFLKVRPEDNPFIIFDDLDFADLLPPLEERFKFHFPRKELPPEFDGSFDSIVRYIARNGRWSNARPDRDCL